VSRTPGTNRNRLPALAFSVKTMMETAMPDDMQDRGAQDRARINIHQEFELRYWSKRFGVTADELKAAVQKVGVSVPAVAEELGKSVPAGSERIRSSSAH
jgi:hypothetical protein